jgi:hypothetical protein
MTAEKDETAAVTVSRFVESLTGRHYDHAFGRIPVRVNKCVVDATRQRPPTPFPGGDHGKSIVVQR